MSKRAPLHDRHVALGARFGKFAGWEMPLSYAGTVSEHHSVRERVGIFDVSHLGKLLVTGDARAALNRVTTKRMEDLATGRARYSMACSESGGIVDDLICYGLDDERVLVVPNASNSDAILGVIRAAGGSVTSLDWCVFAVQGPASRKLVEDRWPQTQGMAYMSVIETDGLVIARSGYTGEWGYELFAREPKSGDLWDELVMRVADSGGEPCGLGARDTLRLEMGYPLHGMDIGPDVTPYESSASWAVDLDSREFVGRSVLLEAKASRELVGLLSQTRLIPRADCEVFVGDQRIGVVTSGTMSPTLRKGIALARLDVERPKGHIEVEVRGKRGTFEIIELPFVDRNPRREPYETHHGGIDG